MNVCDKRPDPTYGTAAIVDFAKVRQVVPWPPTAGTAFTSPPRARAWLMVFNGEQTVDVQNDKFRSSPIAPQSAGGTIRLRKMQVRSI